MIDLTPLDVRKKRGDIAKVLRGYDPEEVDTFLEIVAERLEELVKENMTLKERSERLAEQVQSLETREHAVHEALVTAQELSGEISEQARRESLLVRREAEAEAGRIRHAAEEYAEEVLREAERLMEERKAALRELDRTRERFLRGFRTLLERELDGVAVAEDHTAVSPNALELDLADWREQLADIKARAPEPLAVKPEEPPADVGRQTAPPSEEAMGADPGEPSLEELAEPPALPPRDPEEPEDEDVVTSPALGGEPSMWASPQAADEVEEPTAPPARETVMSGRIGPDQPETDGRATDRPDSGDQPLGGEGPEEVPSGEVEARDVDLHSGDVPEPAPDEPATDVPGMDLPSMEEPDTEEPETEKPAAVEVEPDGVEPDDAESQGGAAGPQPWDPEYEVPYPGPSEKEGQQGPPDQELPPSAGAGGQENPDEDDTLWLKGLMEDRDEDRSGP